MHKIKRPRLKMRTMSILATVLIAMFMSLAASLYSYSGANAAFIQGGGATPAPATPAANSCGGSGESVVISIDIGCQHKGNPIADASFAIIRFLSDGVGLVIIGSLIVAGIQYSSSRGDPQSSAKAMQRIQSSILALLVFIFSYAILDYVLPNGFLK